MAAGRNPLRAASLHRGIGREMSHRCNSARGATYRSFGDPRPGWQAQPCVWEWHRLVTKSVVHPAHKNGAAWTNVDPLLLPNQRGPPPPRNPPPVFANNSDLCTSNTPIRSITPHISQRTTASIAGQRQTQRPHAELVDLDKARCPGAIRRHRCKCIAKAKTMRQSMPTLPRQPHPAQSRVSAAG